eukprot:5856197-Prymnesium_polylepis.1
MVRRAARRHCWGGGEGPATFPGWSKERRRAARTAGRSAIHASGNPHRAPIQAGWIVVRPACADRRTRPRTGRRSPKASASPPKRWSCRT